MRRLAYILLNATTLASLILALAVAVFWVRSEIIIQDELLWNIRTPAERRTSALSVRSRLGQVRWGWSERVFASRAYFDDEDPAKPEYRSTPPNGIPRYPGLHFFVRRFPRPPTPALDTFWQRRGFWFERYGPAPVSPGALASTLAWTLVSVPHWLLLLAFAALPAVRVTRHVRAARREKSGLCASCGYDLRATPGRCPECGTIQP
jgi:hypothetical protein